LADEQNPQVAIARERIREAMAVQDRAELLCLPALEAGVAWLRHDGPIQRASGEVIPVSRSSLFVGGGPALSLDLADAIFAPLAARKITEARISAARATGNDLLLEVALTYIDLLQTYAELQISIEAHDNARHLLELTQSHEDAGRGAAADTARARTEANQREADRREVEGRIRIVTARLAELLQLPPDIQLRPIEPAAVPVTLVPENIPLPELIGQALSNRPELAENRALIEAAGQRWRAARLSPLIPTLRLGYAGGGFGGGRDAFFGDFDWRSDVAANAVWQLDQLGLGNRALQRERYSQYSQTVFRHQGIAAAVAGEVTSAHAVASARRQQLSPAERAVTAARTSYRLNEERIRRVLEQARPIELLQAIQALARSRQDYLQTVADYNRAQFRLYTALGNPPQCSLGSGNTVPTTESTIPKIEPESLPPPKKDP
jgi:outer membrane protein TolC